MKRLVLIIRRLLLPVLFLSIAGTSGASTIRIRWKNGKEKVYEADWLFLLNSVYAKEQGIPISGFWKNKGKKKIHLEVRVEDIERIIVD